MHHKRYNDNSNKLMITNEVLVEKYIGKKLSEYSENLMNMVFLLHPQITLH